METIQYYTSEETINILNAVPFKVKLELGIDRYTDEKNRNTPGDRHRFTIDVHRNDSFKFLVAMQSELEVNIKNELDNAKRWADNAAFSQKILETVNEMMSTGFNKDNQLTMADVCAKLSQLNKTKFLEQEEDDKYLAKEVIREILTSQFDSHSLPKAYA